jgi:hypothetical protein
MCDSFFKWKNSPHTLQALKYKAWLASTVVLTTIYISFKTKSHMVRIICVENYNQMSTARTIIRMAKIKTTTTFWDY